MNYNWLTPRDENVYNFLNNNAIYATTTQLSELFYSKNEHGKIANSKAICRRRMAKLQEYFPNIQSFFWQANKDKIYTSIPPKFNVISINSISHSLALVDLFIRVHNYANTQGHIIYNILFEIKLLNGVIPDIILIYIINKKARIFFIEYDTGTESLPRIKQKLVAYQTYFEKQLYLSESWQPSKIKPEVVFITLSQNRANKINKLGGLAYTDITEKLKFN